MSIKKSSGKILRTMLFINKLHLFLWHEHCLMFTAFALSNSYTVKQFSLDIVLRTEQKYYNCFKRRMMYYELFCIIMPQN